jgi:hypothetical protein
MTVEFARMRIAKIRNEMCYSNKVLNKKGNNIKDNSMEANYPNWFEIR